MKRRASQSASTVRIAAALAARFPLELLHATAVEVIRDCPPRERVAIACSGGADSVALLWLLWAHFPGRRGRWLILHFDHGLRGRASAGDARFVGRLAESLGERFEIGTWLDRDPAKKKPPSEADARAARWIFFTAAMRRARARVIALGHQLDDVAETMLMRLTRGSGSSGLAAPRPLQRIGADHVRVRPLLRIPAALLRHGLESAGARWREDATNATDDYFRNRVRRRVLPALIKAAERDALFGFGDARAQLEDDDAALETWLGELVPAPSNGEPYDLSVLRRKPPALIRRAIHHWGVAVGLTPSPGKLALDWLVAAVSEGRDTQLSAGPDRFIVVRRGQLSLRIARAAELAGEPWPWSHLDPRRDLVGPRGDRLSLRRVRVTPRLFARIRAGEFPQDAMAHLAPGSDWPGWLGVRAWQAGDRYRPIGAAGRAKLQDLFVNRRVPRELRALLPVVVNPQGNVLWAPGLPLAEEVAVQPASKLVVQLTYTPAPPIVHRSIDHIPTDVRPRKA